MKQVLIGLVSILLVMTILCTAYGDMTNTTVDFSFSSFLDRVAVVAEDFVPLNSFGSTPAYDDYTDPEENVFQRVSSFFTYFADLVKWTFNSYVNPLVQDTICIFRLVGCFLPFAYTNSESPYENGHRGGR